MTLHGESGLGKSTLLNALIDQEPGVEFMGQITLDGHRMDADARLSTESQTVFQEPLLFPHLSIGANIELSMHRCAGIAREARGSVIRSAGSSRNGLYRIRFNCLAVK